MRRKHSFNLLPPLKFTHLPQLYLARPQFARNSRAAILLLCSLGLGLNVAPAFAQGIITAVAGNGETGFKGNGWTAIGTPLNLTPYTVNIAVDVAGSRYIADRGSLRIARSEAASLDLSGRQARSEDPLAVVPTASGGIREVIPEKYSKRYQEWKKEFLSTETGRSQWAQYANNPRFLLTITVSRENHQNGAGTGKYVWNDSEMLVAATITLGYRIDEGYPNPVDCPVLNSLASVEAHFAKNGRNILAAAKIAHEFGHVNNTVRTNGAFFRLQNQLISTYNRILLSNGRNTRDPRLIALSKQMGGTATEIWEIRESCGEANALLYLRDKIARQILPCRLFTIIRQNLELLAENYAHHFVQINKSQPTLPACAAVNRPEPIAGLRLMTE